MNLPNPKLTLRQSCGLLAGCFALAAALLMWNPEIRGLVVARLRLSRESVSSRLAQIAVRKPWIEDVAAQIGDKLLILVFKSERLVEVNASGWDSPRIYKMTNFSGKPGPKLREGDGQIPEGIYGVEYLNPNSAFHLSIKVTYPNAFDRSRAKEDGRSQLGGDIMIHGGSATIGCVPLGDDAIEEVFYFVAKAGSRNTIIVMAPYDMRKGRQPELEQSPLPWYGALCDEIAVALAGCPLPVEAKNAANLLGLYASAQKK